MKDTEKELGSSIALFSSADEIDYEEDDAISIHTRKKSRPSVTGTQRRVSRENISVIRTAEAMPRSATSKTVQPTAKPRTAQPKPASAQTAQTRPTQAKPAQARPTAAAAPRPTASATRTAARPVQAKPAEAAVENKAAAPRPTTRPTASAAKPQSEATKASASRFAEAKPTSVRPQSAQPQTKPQSAPMKEKPQSEGTASADPSTVKSTEAATATRPTAVRSSAERTESERPISRPITTIQSIPRPAEPEADDDILTTPRQSARLTKSKKKLTAGCVVRRSLLVFFTVLFFAVSVLLAVCNTLANGPSQTARDKAVMSALQASATKWVPGLFLSDEVVEQIKADSTVVITDVKPITDISSGDSSGEDAEDRWANAIDGMIYENVNGSTFKGYVLLIKDPSRVTVGVSSDDFKNATIGMRIFELADKYDAIAAINAGEFRDDGGMGTGYAPMGLTYSDGECVWNDGLKRTFMGFDENDRLFVGEGTTYAEAEELGMRDAVSFQTGNVLITNDGENVTYYYADSNTGVAQRTAIGQCADGTVIFLVTDGRTASSMGATRNEIIDTLISYGAITAGMLDGGSSSMLYYRDYYEKYNIDKSLLDEYQLMGLVNKYKAFTSPRYIPTYFIVK